MKQAVSKHWTRLSWAVAAAVIGLRLGPVPAFAQTPEPETPLR